VVGRSGREERGTAKASSGRRGQEVGIASGGGDRTPPSRELICFSIPLGQGVVGVFVGRSPRDGYRIVALHLVEKGIDASDNVFVGNRFDGAGRKQFDAIETGQGCSAVGMIGRGICAASGSSPEYGRRR